MIELHWHKYNHPRAITIQLDENTPLKFIIEMIRRLVGGSYDCIGQQPRGRRWIYFMEDAAILEQQPNPECTGWAGTKICGDAVIITPDLHKRIESA